MSELGTNAEFVQGNSLQGSVTSDLILKELSKIAADDTFISFYFGLLEK